MRSNSTERQSLIGVKSLGVDFGTIRTGVAVTIGYAPCPLPILQNMNTTEVAIKIVQLCQSESVSQVVVGWPIHKNGTVSEQANVTREFADLLSSSCYARFGPTFRVLLFDERYSSKEAQARLMSSQPTKDHSYTRVDSDSACIILEHFYAENGKGSHLVPVPEHMLESCHAAWKLQERENQNAMERMQRMRLSNIDVKKQAMERAMKIEAELAFNGTLGTSRKKSKNKKRKKSSSKWITL